MLVAMTGLEIKWLATPELHDYDAAEQYLELVL